MISFIICEVVFVFFQTFQEDDARNQFFDINGEKSIVQFISAYENTQSYHIKPYVIAAYMQQANFTGWPHKKWQYFNKGKKRLDAFINDHPSCIDGRFVRLVVQSQTPGFLGYKADILLDRQYVLDNIINCNISSSNQKKIINIINSIQIK